MGTGRGGRGDTACRQVWGRAWGHCVSASLGLGVGTGVSASLGLGEGVLRGGEVGGGGRGGVRRGEGWEGGGMVFAGRKMGPRPRIARGHGMGRVPASLGGRDGDAACRVWGWAWGHCVSASLYRWLGGDTAWAREGRWGRAWGWRWWGRRQVWGGGGREERWVPASARTRRGAGEDGSPPPPSRGQAMREDTEGGRGRGLSVSVFAAYYCASFSRGRGAKGLICEGTMRLYACQQTSGDFVYRVDVGLGATGMAAQE